MVDRSDQQADALMVEIAACERYADELAGFARSVRARGHEDAAERLLHFSRKHRIAALELYGKLAALTAPRSGTS